MIVQSCNLSTWEVKREVSRVQCHFGYKASLRPTWAISDPVFKKWGGWDSIKEFRLGRPDVNIRLLH